MKNKISSNLLKPVALYNYLKGLLAIPAGFISAEMTSIIANEALSGQTDEVIRQSLYFALFFIVYQILCLGLNMLSGRVSERNIFKYKTELYRMFLKQPPYLALKYNQGRFLTSFTKDLNQIVAFQTSAKPRIINALLMAGAYFGYLLINNELVALALLGIGLIQCIFPIIIKKFLVTNYDENAEAEKEITEHILAGHKGLATIKSFNLMDWFLQKLAALQKKAFTVGMKTEAIGSTENMVEKFISYLLQFGTYAVIGWFILIEIINIELGLKAIVLSSSLYNSIKTTFTLIPEFAVNKKAESRLIELVSYESPVYKQLNIDDSDALYRVRNLTFSHIETKEILKNVSFDIIFGEVVLIKGANGQGKTTLINLLLGLLGNYSGQIEFCGVNLQDISPDDYFQYISAVLQREEGFDSSPEEFFNMLNLTNTFHVTAALDLAKSMGLSDENITRDRLKKLSGGEFKKLYLVAGLLKDSKVLFLDEPSNSLDDHSRLVVKDIIRDSQKTFIIITHDTFYDDIATKTILINDGNITVAGEDGHEKTSSI